jgi:hypothetical protein
MSSNKGDQRINMSLKISIVSVGHVGWLRGSGMGMSVKVGEHVKRGWDIYEVV